MPPKTANKDPNKPKGRMSAYAFFLKGKRELYRQQDKDVQFTAFSKECADEWNDFSVDKKTKYNTLAEADKLRYKREMEMYEPGPGYDSKGKKEGGGKRRRKKKEKDPNMPKRAMSAFFWFAGDKRPKLKEQNPGATVGDIAKQLGAAWKIMTKEQKYPYEESARKDRGRYETQIKAYRTKKSNAVTEEDDEDDEEEEEDCVSEEED